MYKSIRGVIMVERKSKKPDEYKVYTCKDEYIYSIYFTVGKLLFYFPFRVAQTIKILETHFGWTHRPGWYLFYGFSINHKLCASVVI